MNGEKVISNKITSSITAVDFTGFSPGIYIVKVVNGDKIINDKVIKK
jgi:hypothetical protein